LCIGICSGLPQLPFRSGVTVVVRPVPVASPLEMERPFVGVAGARSIHPAEGDDDDQ